MPPVRRYRVLLANMFGVLVLLLLIEAGVRLFVPGVHPTGTDRSLVQDSAHGVSAGLAPAAVGTSNGAWFEVAADGYWTYRRERDPNLPSWLFLGDSVTMGIGVDPDSTFAGRLAAAMDSMNVLNTGLIAYAVDDYRRVFESILARRADPRSIEAGIEHVTVFWCLNDVYGPSVAAGDPGTQVRRLGGPVLRFLQRHYRTYQWIKAVASDRARSYFEYAEVQYQSDSLVVRATREVAAMAARAREEGLRFDVVLLPFEYQLREPGRFGPQDRLLARIQADSVHVRDARSALLEAGLPPTDLYLYGDGIHLSQTGHAAIAEFVAGLPLD